MDINNWRLDRGLSDFDRKHVVIANWIYDLPVGRGKHFLRDAKRPLDLIAGGWSLNGIGVYQSGQPFSVLSGALTANGTHQSYAGGIGGTLPKAQLQNFPGVVGPVLFPGNAGFALPAAGSDGIGRNSFRGPNFWNVDLSASKTFPLRERFRLIFRAEAFNLFNHVNWTTGDLNALSPTFGQNLTEVATGGTRNVVINGESNRVLQLALRLAF